MTPTLAGLLASLIRAERSWRDARETADWVNPDMRLIEPIGQYQRRAADTLVRQGFAEWEWPRILTVPRPFLRLADNLPE